MSKIVAMGKIGPKGEIIRATPGVKVEVADAEPTGTYIVTLPVGSVHDENYIVQLTAQQSESDSDFDPTVIGLHYQSVKGFYVQIWAREVPIHNTIKPNTSVWHFVVYDLD